MSASTPLIDVDRHVIEPIEMWPAYLEARFRADAPQLTPRAEPSTRWEDRLARLGEYALWKTPPVLTVAGRAVMDIPERAALIAMEQGGRRGEDVAPTLSGEHHRAAMQRGGVDIGVILPSYALYLVYNDHFDVALSRGFAQAYNRWILDYCSADPQRMRPAAIISRQDPACMSADLETALRQGFRSVVLRPNPILGRTVSDPAMLPFFEACAQASVPVLFHEGSHAQVEAAGTNRYATRFGQHACSHPFEAMMALLSLLEGGVLERCPALRVGFLEAGCTWLPHWLWRLDQLEYRHMQGEVAGRVNKLPSAYVREQCWFAFECDETLLAETFASVSTDRFVFGSDYPHVDHDLDAQANLAVLSQQVTPPQLRQLLWDNACQLFGWSPEVPA
jgi:predicted TIM-barrel fold metal-dependent hydrolase